MNIQADSQPFFINLFHFTGMLRQAGLPVSLEQKMDFIRSLEMVDIGSRDQVYHAARCMLVTDKEDISLFDRIFDYFWRAPHNEPAGQKSPIAPRHDVPKRDRASIVTLMAQKADPADPEVNMVDKSGTYSPAELLQAKAFAHMTPAELEAVKKLIQAMRWQASLRQTRRRIPDAQGNSLDLRRVMRDAAKHGGTPLNLAWHSRKIKRRPVVILADISGSMEKYSRLLLQFCYSVSHSLSNVESFVFGTRLSRVTLQLRSKNIDRALNEAAMEVVDWAGGTRIGESLQTFNQEWSRRVLRRGVIVLIVSDGWERGDMATLRREMRYLQHRCHRLIWLNPHLGNEAYRPLVEGMAAALPFVDDFLPIHNLQSLAALGKRLATLRK